MKKNKHKIVRPRPSTPKGFKDYFHLYSKKRVLLIKDICEVYELYGFENLETSAIENLDALGKYLPDIDRPNQGVFSWKDEENNWLALRYDLTAPLARVYAQHLKELPLPYRRYLGDLYGKTKNLVLEDIDNFINVMQIQLGHILQFQMQKCV